jgi:2-keto-4-pentenoate hydratase/2-oxohepta-3-ene-1,7-dioic acid hydratase in catechol pathway
MKLGRVQRTGPSGPTPRVVIVDVKAGVVVDVQRAEQVRLERLGFTPAAARRLVAARLPQDIAEGLGAPSYREDLESALSVDPPDDAVLELAAVTWLTPIEPPRFRDFMAFEQHYLSARHLRGTPVPDVLYELPVYYKGSHHSLIAHDASVPWPGYCDWMDFELELGFVVGRAGIDLTPEAAERCLFGVTLLNDFSARDRQFEEVAAGLGPAKGKDFATAVGPYIATVDELDLLSVQLEARVNGEVWSSGLSGSAQWSPAELLAYLSQGEPLIPGELIGSGTVGGGCGLELGRRLIPGDVVELSAAELGRLRNQLGSPSPASWSPPRRVPGRMIDGREGVSLTELASPRDDAPPPPFPRQ